MTTNKLDVTEKEISIQKEIRKQKDIDRMSKKKKSESTEEMQFRNDN